jgi:hypothetical protein
MENPSQKMTGGLAQGIGSEFKLQYWKNKLHVDHGFCLETVSSSFILVDEVNATKVPSTVELCVQTFLRIHSLRTSDFCLLCFFFCFSLWECDLNQGMLTSPSDVNCLVEAKLQFSIMTEIIDPLFNKKLGWFRSIQFVLLLLLFSQVFSG